MARSALTTRSARTAFGTVTFGIVAMVALGACSSSTDGTLTPAGSAGSTSSSTTDATAAPKPKTHKVEKVADVHTSAAVKTTSTRSDGAATGATLKYKKIVEPFGTPGRCNESGTTIEMTACVLKKVVDVDYTVDVLQQQRFGYAISTADRKADLRDDANWLANRTKTCAAQAGGGSLDQITQAQCLLKASKARVSSLS